MCGICGVIHRERQRPVQPPILERMNDAIRHRGPDSDGFFIQDSVGLAMRRLSIIDVADGDQPIYNEDGSIAIVFNGEIYGYQKLRESLLQAGHIFRTHTDTECIIHAYEQYGLDCVDHLNGMFAFAIWDSNEQRVFIARDRTGIKPLYYAQVDDSLIFASELKSLVQYPQFPRDIDLRALDKYLTYEYVPTPYTIFEAARKLPPGHALTFQQGDLNIWQYWDMQLEESEVPQTTSFEDAARGLRQVLSDVVRQELVSDVPIGVLLSGGVDSSAIAALATEIMPNPIETFSIRFEDKSFDESKFAHLVSNHLGTNHHELTLTIDTAKDIITHRIPHYMDEPLADSSFIPTMLLSGFTRDHVTVALGGDGGDEIFAGYSTLQAHRLMSLYQNVMPSPLRSMAERVVNMLPTSFNNISLDFKLKRFARGHKQPFEMRHQYWLGSFEQNLKERLFVQRSMANEDRTFGIVWDHVNHSQANDVLNKVLYLDMKMYLEGDILPKVDRTTMSHSLEVRVPFLNQLVLQYAACLPIEYKLRGLTTKAILRESVKDDLPPEIVNRTKKGFNMPVAKWLTEDLREWTHDLLAPDRIKRQGIFDYREVNRLLTEHMSQRQDWRKQLWTLLIFQQWWDHWSQ